MILNTKQYQTKSNSTKQDFIYTENYTEKSYNNIFIKLPKRLNKNHTIILDGLSKNIQKIQKRSFMSNSLMEYVDNKEIYHVVSFLIIIILLSHVFYKNIRKKP